MSWKFTMFLGVALMAYAGWLARQQHVWLKSAQVVPGTVAELIHVPASRGKGSYRPRVRYTTPDGVVHDFVRGFATNPAGLAVGEPVGVAYRPAAPQEARIVTFGQRFGFAALLAVLGVCLLLLGAVFEVGRHCVPRLYLQGQGRPDASPGR